MAMRVSGINSGLDTDAIVQELVSAYSKKTEKVQQDQTKLSWKQEIWKNLNTKVYGLYTSISALRYSGAYAIKKTTVSDASKATVSASGNAVNGTQKLNILQTAQSGYLTGGKLTTVSGEKISAEDTTLKDLGFTEEGTLRIKTTNADGEVTTKDITLKKDSTIADVTKQFSEAGLNASFDEGNGRFYISSKASGTAGDFTIEAADSMQVPKMDDDGNVLKDKDDNVIYETIYAADNDKMAAKMAVSNRLLGALGLSDSDRTAGNAIKTKSGTVANTKNTMSDLGYRGADTTIIFDTTVNGKTVHNALTVSTTTRIEDVIDQFKSAGVNASFDGTTGKFTFEGAENITFTGGLVRQKDADGNSIPDPDHPGEFLYEMEDDGVTYKQDPNSFVITDLLGLTDSSGASALKTDASRNAIKIEGQDAVIVLNGAVYTSNTNNFSINGLNITANGVTDNVAIDKKPDGSYDLDSINVSSLMNSSNAITITTNTDNQGLYDKVKDFLTQYNAIINEITKLYNADSAYGYNPLTDEEKDSMSDSQIEKWETKIKDSLLRRDNSLSAIMSSMINAMNKNVTIGGKNYNLTSFGIHTLGFLNAVENEQNAFHIDGDAEDENTSGNEEKLMKAINEDPETVIEFMKQLTTNLYQAIDDNMQSSSMRSKYKIYNDKEMDKQYTAYTKKIKEWEDRVAAKEDYYYKKFSKMETALAKLNSQTNSLSGLFGSGR